MTAQNSAELHFTIEFLSKDCKSQNHFSCSHQWEGFGFNVICNCECHRNLVFYKDVLKHDSNNEMSS